METILATAFGWAIDIQRGESDDLTRAVDDFFISIQEGEFFDANVLVSLFSELYNGEHRGIFLTCLVQVIFLG